MDIFLGYSGLAVAFIILAAIHLYFIIYSDAKVIIKAVIIPAVLWYGLTLFYTPGNLMGWPTSQPMPDNSRVLSMMIREPRGDRPGSIYILALGYVDLKKIKNKPDIDKLLEPKHIFYYTKDNIPRFYRLPYDRELHKKLKKGEKEAKKKGGFMKIKKGKRNDNINKWKDMDRFEVEVVDPRKLMPK